MLALQLKHQSLNSGCRTIVMTENFLQPGCREVKHRTDLARRLQLIENVERLGHEVQRPRKLEPRFRCYEAHGTVPPDFG